MPELSIIIVSWNVREYLLKCISSVKEHVGAIAHEIIVVDNNSSDGSVELVAKHFSDVVIIHNKENIGFARANNQGFEQSKGEFLLLLNPDTEVRKGSICTVLDFMKKEERAGVAGCRIVGGNGQLQKSVHRFSTIAGNIIWAMFLDRILFPELRNKYYYQKDPFKVDSITGAFMMVRRAAVGNGPLLNPEYFMYAEEKDMMLKFGRSGWETWFIPTTEIIHYGGMSTSLIKQEMFLQLQKSQVLFYKAFYSKGFALALCVTWWLILLSHALASLLIAPIKGSARLMLFVSATLAFPGYVFNDFFRR